MPLAAGNSAGMPRGRGINDEEHADKYDDGEHGRDPDYPRDTPDVPDPPDAEQEPPD
ncbi:hypothetical protein MMAGJ_31650 [Mycolicibacterium mageritense]|uniref:Uncharacterized protein n=1 Tax=Mycolicibacterium mageritense TaxID=53462 RepID=A0ABM7HTH6_MYCME|nr:hypothetical protein MMAGJ_31650 [Mycolicibacterium mageritense]